MPLEFPELALVVFEPLTQAIDALVHLIELDIRGQIGSRQRRIEHSLLFKRLDLPQVSLEMTGPSFDTDGDAATMGDRGQSVLGVQEALEELCGGFRCGQGDLLLSNHGCDLVCHVVLSESCVMRDVFRCVRV